MSDFDKIALTSMRERVSKPGWSSLPANTERYRVRGGGALSVAIDAGDLVTVIDVEGIQACELVMFDQNWIADSGLLNVKCNGSGDALRQWLNSSKFETSIAAKFKQHNVDLSNLSSVSIFGPDSKAGDTVSYTANENGALIALAPGGPMVVSEQNPPTEIELQIKRARPAGERPIILPDPLGTPLQDFQINRATAVSYEVKAGEFIQLIDVQGQQCADLQAFSVANLDKGIERCLDVTTTRTLMAQGYPGPGNLAKYYDQEMQPMIEIIQDTCQRHDAFGLACTSKYYDDLGYPGHVNCSDNFNHALKNYPIAARRGWMAMNFFYNTGIDDHNNLHLDEPWSRAGDYVLLKALSDLVIVSSSCSDDIDAANAWNPTDIHVRTYSPDKSFRSSIGYRKRPEAEVTMTKETGFHTRTSALTRDYVEYNGYWMPNSYTNHGAIAEYWACREKAIIMDLSVLRKFEVIGTDAEALMQQCITRNVRRMSDGHVVYTAMCYDTGTMIDDGTLFRLGPNNFRWIGGSDYGGEWLRLKAEELGLDNVHIKSSTDQLHNVAVQGPLSRDILKELIWTPPTHATMDEMDWFKFSIARIGGFDGIPVIVSRTGYSGELGYEVFCHPKDAPAVWDAIWEVGEPQGMLPLGLEALDMLRIESGLIFADYEFDDQTDPYEAGIGFTVPLKSKEEDFIGRDALVRRKANPQRKLVGLELVGDEPAEHGDCVRVGRHQVGIVTSAMRSPILKKNIALCRMVIEHSEIGTEVEVGKLDGHSKRLPATVVPFPFYDPEKKRPRS